MKDTNKNYRAPRVKYLGPTDHRGARVRITDLREISKPRTIDYNYDDSSCLDTAVAFLTAAGWEIEGSAEEPGGFIVLTRDFRRVL